MVETTFELNCYPKSAEQEPTDFLILPSNLPLEPQSDGVIYCRITSERGIHVYGRASNITTGRGICRLPEWMFRTLRVANGDKVTIQGINPPKATSIMVSSTSKDFRRFFNNETLRNRVLTKFACLFVGQKAYYVDNDHNKHQFEVVQTLPGPVVRVNSRMKVFVEVPQEHKTNVSSSNNSNGTGPDSSSTFDDPQRPEPTQRVVTSPKTFCVYSIEQMIIPSIPPNFEKGNKIVLPASLLYRITTTGRLEASSPMIFKIMNKSNNRSTYCGALEFTAHCGTCHLPSWIMKQLNVTNGDRLRITLREGIAKGTYAKLQPCSAEFMTKLDPKGYLERAFEHFTCISQNETITLVDESGTKTEIRVLETKPAPTILTIQCELAIDIVPPEGYRPPKKENKNMVSKAEQEAIDFAPPEVIIDEAHNQRMYKQRGVPDFRYKFGKLKFIRMKPS